MMKNHARRIPVVQSFRRRRDRAKPWRKLVWLLCAALLYGAYVYLGGSTGLIQFWRLHQRYGRVNKQIAVLESRQDSLKQVIHLLQNDTSYIEKIARERFYMGRPGETIYLVIKKPEATEDK